VTAPMRCSVMGRLSAAVAPTHPARHGRMPGNNPALDPGSLAFNIAAEGICEFRAMRLVLYFELVRFP
jgi:hypothetical protein